MYEYVIYKTNDNSYWIRHNATVLMKTLGVMTIDLYICVQFVGFNRIYIQCKHHITIYMPYK